MIMILIHLKTSSFRCVILSFTQSPVPNVSNEDIELGSIDDAIDNEHQKVQLVHVLMKNFLGEIECIICLEKFASRMFMNNNQTEEVNAF